MNLELKKIVAGAVSGLVAALVVDVNAWSKTDEKFDWLLAFKRWVAGAVTGALATLGVTSI